MTVPKTNKTSFLSPNTSKIDIFDGWDDLKKEYLVDFINSEEEISVFNPEYFTVIKDYNQKYFSNVKIYEVI